MIQSLFKKLFSSQLRLNMLSGAISTGLGVVVSASKYPLYLHFLGYERYGVWLLLSTVLTFAQIGLLGIAPAIIKLVAEEYEKSNNRAIQEYFMTSLCMLLAIGVILLTVTMLFKWQIIRLMGLESENAELIGSLLIYMVLFSISVLAYQVLNSILAGLGRVDLANYSQTVLQALPLLISIPLLLSGKGVISLLLANAFSYLLIFSLNFIRLNRLVSINILDISSFSWRRFQKLIAFGGTILAGSMANMMVLPITKIVITRSIGIEAVPVFELAYRVGMQLRSIFEVALRALMPEISKLSSDGSQESIVKMKKLIAKAYRVLFWGAVPLYTLSFVFAGEIFKVWLGENFISSIPSVFRVMLFVTFINLIGVIPYYVYMGQGIAIKLLFYHLICAGGTLLLLGFSIGILSRIEVTSVAWCFVAGATLGTAYLFIFQGHNNMRIVQS